MFWLYFERKTTVIYRRSPVGAVKEVVEYRGIYLAKGSHTHKRLLHI